MTQENVGAFMQKMRREKGMTQKELADILHISDKTISKWETGKGIPDVSYLENICTALGVTINELLSGQKLPPEEYPQKAEDNMLYLLQENHETKKQNRMSLLLGGILLILGVTGLFMVSGSNMTWYLDLPSLLVLACICTALTLFSGKRTKREVIPFLRKIVLPVGVCESLVAVVCVVGNVQDIPLLGANLAVCILSVLYALIAYLALLVMEQRMR